MWPPIPNTMVYFRIFTVVITIDYFFLLFYIAPHSLIDCKYYWLLCNTQHLKIRQTWTAAPTSWLEIRKQTHFSWIPKTCIVFNCNFSNVHGSKTMHCLSHFSKLHLHNCLFFYTLYLFHVICVNDVVILYFQCYAHTHWAFPYLHITWP